MEKVPIFEIQDGPQKGERYLISAGQVLGGSKADIQIKNNHIDDLGCVVQQQGEGKFALFSQRNESPLTINDRRVKKVSLLPGVLFTVGVTSIKVLYIDQVDAEKLSQKDLWKNELQKMLGDLSFENNFKNIKPNNLNRPLKIEFTLGPLLQEIHEIGYLPRTFGMAQVSFDLQDLSLPREVFQLTVEKDDIFVSHLSSIPVFVNDKKIEAKTKLKMNDRISCGNTELRINSL